MAPIRRSSKPSIRRSTTYKHGSWSRPKCMDLSTMVLPRSVVVAMPCGLVAMCFSIVTKLVDEQNSLEVLRNVAAWSAFSFLVTFLVVFRTSQSYLRFWEGCTACHRMRAEWFDACSALMAFTRGSKADKQQIVEFKQKLVRLFSLLHGVALSEMEDRGHEEELKFDSIEAYSFELLDPMGLDRHSLDLLLRADHKAELLYQWIQCLIIDSFHSGVLAAPPPIVTRAYQELSGGMVAFHEAQKVSKIPLPLPYVQACDWMLILHWLFIPIVVPQFVYNPGWAFAFTFIQVFILWGLNFTAKEIENPFGGDENDMDRKEMQTEMNSVLKFLVNDATNKVPFLINDNSTNDNDLSQISTLVSVKSIVEDSPMHSPMHSAANEEPKLQLGKSSDAAGAAVPPSFATLGGKSERVQEDQTPPSDPDSLAKKASSSKHKEQAQDQQTTMDFCPVVLEVTDGPPTASSVSSRCQSGHGLVHRLPSTGCKCIGCGVDLCPSILAWRCGQCAAWGCGPCSSESGVCLPANRTLDAATAQPPLPVPVLEHELAHSLEGVSSVGRRGAALSAEKRHASTRLKVDL